MHYWVNLIKEERGAGVVEMILIIVEIFTI